MKLSIHTNEKETELIKKFAKMKGKSVSEVIRQAIFDKIEDDWDIRLGEKVLKETEKNPVDYSIETVKKKLDHE